MEGASSPTPDQLAMQDGKRSCRGGPKDCEGMERGTIATEG